VVIFITLGLSFGYLTFKALSYSKTVEVPDLYGKSLLDSNKVLAKKVFTSRLRARSLI
jgi:hypothetical protein